MRRSFVRFLSVILVSLAIAVTLAAQPRSFHELVDAYFDDYFKANPSAATSVGFHQYDHQLEDFSLAAHQQNRQRLQKYLAEFEAIDPRPLTPLDRDDRDGTVGRERDSRGPAHS